GGEAVGRAVDDEGLARRCVEPSSTARTRAARRRSQTGDGAATVFDPREGTGAALTTSLRFGRSPRWCLPALALTVSACEGSHFESNGVKLECAPSDSAFRDAAELFGVEGVPRFELVMEETTYEAHQRRALEEEYTPVTACYDGERIGRIAVRFKGQVGTLQNCFQ